MNRPRAFVLPRRATQAALAGAPIGMLGGLIGLGGAEFRLPVLKVIFRYTTDRAVVMNLAISLVTLIASLLIRAVGVNAADLLRLVPLIASLTAGSVTGAWIGAGYASRISVEQLERLVLVLLTTIGALLAIEGLLQWQSAGIPFEWPVRVPVAVIIGLGIGAVSSLLGVAGGELIIPTLVFVFGADIKSAGTASVIISLPTVAIGCFRYARRGALFDQKDWAAVVLPMGAASVGGALVGGLLVPYVSSQLLKVLLGVILIFSAIRIFRHRQTS